MNKLLYFFVNLLHLAEDPNKSKAVLEMRKKMDELGGLQFSITVDENGWMAECKNLPGIITSGLNLNCPFAEVDSNIKDAIFSAFAIPSHLCDERMIKGPFNLEPKSSVDQIALIYTGRSQFAQ